MTATAPALFVVFATDRAGSGNVRASVRDAHRAHLRNPPADADVAVVAGGPTLDAAGTMNGTLLVVAATSVDAVQRFLAVDPYVQNDVFATIEVRPWRLGLLDADALAAALR